MYFLVPEIPGALELTSKAPGPVRVKCTCVFMGRCMCEGQHSLSNASQVKESMDIGRESKHSL